MMKIIQSQLKILKILQTKLPKICPPMILLGLGVFLGEEHMTHHFITVVSQNAVQMIPMHQMDCGLLTKRYVLKLSAVQDDLRSIISPKGCGEQR